MSSNPRLETHLTCNICGQTYEEPRILPCLHTFCTKCIEGLDAFIPSLPHVSSPTKCTTSPAKSSCTTLSQIDKHSSTWNSSKDSGASGYETEKSPTVSIGSLGLPPSGTTVHDGSRNTILTDYRNRTILCPTCDSEVDLPTDGASRLPLHYILQNKVLAASLSYETNDGASGVKAICELCVGDINAVSWCVNCAVGICAFCSEAHKRQRLTGQHRVISLMEAQHLKLILPPEFSVLRNRDRPRPVCPSHPIEELRFFCDSCRTTVCRDCCAAGGEHRTHRARFVSEVAKEKIGDLKNLLAQALPKADALRASLAGVRTTAKCVQVREAEACREVDDFIEDYIKAVEMHRRNLIGRVRKMCEIKRRILKLQSIQLEQALEDVETLCAFVEQLLKEGTDVEILTLLGHVTKRLKELGVEKHQLEPRVDEYLQFVQDEAGGRVNGFPVRGALTAQKLCPSKCTMKGNGVPVTRQGQKVDITIVAKDTEGQPMRRGGNSPKIEITSKDDKKSIPTKVVDRKDGTYMISFAPEETGLYWLTVKFQENHIQGSPFPLPIKTKWLAHSGQFHCCTFCSSGGNKEMACSCGGTMPGGFKGCGHGHKGHPGKKHWSCCGRFTENSECTRPLPKMYEFTL